MSKVLRMRLLLFVDSVVCASIDIRCPAGYWTAKGELPRSETLEPSCCCFSSGRASSGVGRNRSKNNLIVLNNLISVHNKIWFSIEQFVYHNWFLLEWEYLFSLQNERTIRSTSLVLDHP